MTKQDFINNSMRSIWGNSAAIEDFRKYISGETNIQPNVSNLSLYMSYHGNEFGGLCAFDNDYIIANNLEDIAEELKEISKRFFKAFENNIIVLIRKLEYISNRYKYYSLMNADDMMVESDLIYLGETPFRSNNVKSAGLANLNDCLCEAENYYSDLIDKIILKYESNQAYNLAGITFLIKKISEGDSKYLKLISELERITCTILKLRFDKKDIEDTFDKYIDDENIKKYYKTFKKTLFVKENDKEKELVLIFISNMCLGISPIIDACLKVFYVLCNHQLLFQYNDFFYTADKLNIPNESIIRYCLIQYNNTSYWHKLKERNLDKLKLILDSDSQSFKLVLDRGIKDCLDEDTSKENLLLCISLAFLLRYDKLNSEEKNLYIEKIDDVIIKYIKNAKRGSSVMKDVSMCEFYEDSKYNFSSFKNDDFPCDEEFGIFNSNMPNSSKLIRLCLYLIDYSRVARNLIKFIFANSRYWLNMEYINNYKVGCYKNMEVNTYKRFYNAGFSLNSIVEMFIREKTVIYVYSNLEEEDKKEFIEFLKEHKTEAEEGIEKFHFSFAEITKKYIEILYGDDNGFDIKYIVKAFLLKSKPVAEYVEKRLITKENEVRTYVEELLKVKNKIANDAATRLIRIWDNEKVQEKLNEIKDLASMVKYIESIYTKNNEKNIPYLDEVDYGSVRALNSEEKVPDILTKYYVSEYIMLKELYIINTCKKIEEFIDLYDFRRLLKNILDVWTSDGYKAKYKNIIIPMAITATENQISEIKKQIDFWTENSKPSLATFAVQGLAMNKSKMALLLLDTMSKNYKNKKVKTAALEAMELAAKELNITRDELDDLIVPDLGFDSERKRIFDYGERKFKAILNEKLEITLYDSTGKEIKSLPKASVKHNDNEGMVNTCKEDLKLTKKQIKTIFDAQKPRMSNAIISGRKWCIDTWNELFVQNPIMTAFAIGLVWEELDKNDNIIGTFRYMEDGTFNTSDEEEYQLTEGSYIKLLHPVDIDEETLNSWKEQFEDYEIIQPVNQLYIPIYKLNENDEAKNEIDDFKDKKVYGATFKSIVSKLGLTPCFNSYGDYDGCMYKYGESNIVMRFYVEPFYISDYTSITTLKNIIFYLDNENKENNEQSSIKSLDLKEVPAKLLSFAVLVGNTVTAKTIE